MTSSLCPFAQHFNPEQNISATLCDTLCVASCSHNAKKNKKQKRHFVPQKAFCATKCGCCFLLYFGYSLLLVIVVVSLVLNCDAVLAYSFSKVHFSKDYIVFFPTLCPHSCRRGMCSAWAETAGSRLSAQQQDRSALHKGGEELRPC